MLMQTHTKSFLIALTSMSLAVGSCAKKEEEKEETEESSTTSVSGGSPAATTLTLSGSLAVGSAALSLTPALSEMVLYCISFEALPRAGTSDFGSDGAFSVTMPVNVNFGCFVNSRTDGAIVATFVVDGGDTAGLGSSSTTSLALSGNVALGTLDLGTDGKVKIPTAKIAAAQYAPTAAGIDLDAVHGKEYTMSCVDLGNSAKFAKCKEQIMDGQDSSTVYLRILKATESGKAVLGMGVWKDLAAFQGCGSVDFATGTMGDTVFSQGTIGTFVNDDSLCAKRDPSGLATLNNLQDYYAVSKLSKNGAGYSFRSEDQSEEQNSSCKETHTTAIEFAGNAAEMYGAFASASSKDGCDGNAAGVKENRSESFNVKFVRK